MTLEEAKIKIGELACYARTKGWDDEYTEAVNMAIESLEQTRWIPCSERVPEESLNSVIGWDAYRERCVFVQYIDGYFQITGSYESFDIVAWMPLPEPYGGDAE